MGCRHETIDLGFWALGFRLRTLDSKLETFDPPLSPPSLDLDLDVALVFVASFGFG